MLGLEIMPKSSAMKLFPCPTYPCTVFFLEDSVFFLLSAAACMDH